MWFIISCKVKNNLIKKNFLRYFLLKTVMLICDELVCTIVFLLNLSKNTRCFLAWVCIARADYWFWYYQSIFYSAAWIQQLWFHLYCNWLKSIQGKVLTLVSWTYYLASWSLQTSFTCKNEKKNTTMCLFEHCGKSLTVL